jgi:hypothetical protein
MSAKKETKKRRAAKAKSPAKGKKKAEERKEEAPTTSARPKRVSKKRVPDADDGEDAGMPQIRGAGELGDVTRRLAAKHAAEHADEAEPNEEEFAAIQKVLDERKAGKKKAEEPKKDAKKKTPSKSAGKEEVSQ